MGSKLAVKEFLEAYSEIESHVFKGKMFTDAKDNILKSLTKSSMSDERRASLLQQFTSQIAIGFPQMILEKSLKFFELREELEVKKSHASNLDSDSGKNVADTALIYEQKGLVTSQIGTEAKRTLTEVSKASNLDSDSDLKDTQALLIVEQKKTETQQTQNVIAEKELRQSAKGKNVADTALIYGSPTSTVPL